MQDNEKKQEPVQENKVIFTHAEAFIEPFEKYIKDISEEDSNILRTGFSGGKAAQLNNEKGEYSIKFRALVKKHFDVKVGLIARSVPQCAGGLFLLLEHLHVKADQKTLEDLLQKVVMKTDDYKIVSKEEAVEMMESVTM